jgi:hypothetical protein
LNYPNSSKLLWAIDSYRNLYDKTFHLGSEKHKKCCPVELLPSNPPSNFCCPTVSCHVLHLAVCPHLVRLSLWEMPLDNGLRWSGSAIGNNILLNIDRGGAPEYGGHGFIEIANKHKLVVFRGLPLNTRKIPKKARISPAILKLVSRSFRKK